MKTQCSIIGSALGSLTESPLKALQGNQTGVITFWGVSARGSSPVPALNKCSCVQLTGTAITDALNYFSYVIGHTWTNTPDGGGGTYQQTDAVDPSTLEATSATVDSDTTPPFNLGNPPTWNAQIGYQVGHTGGSTATSIAGTDWDAASTVAGILAALDGVDWAALWADGTSANNNFVYDRATIDPGDSGQLPFGPSGNTGLIVPGNINLGPSLRLTGKVGMVDIFNTASYVGRERAQIQVRNFNGPPIPYFIFEAADVITGISIPSPSTTRANLQVQGQNIVYRKLSEGTWTHDLQTIQLPDSTLTLPQTLTPGIGSCVAGDSFIGMIMGQTFESYLADQFGPTWADYVFT